MGVRMIIQMEARMVAIEAKMERMCRASWKSNELVVVEEEDVEDIGDVKEMDSD